MSRNNDTISKKLISQKFSEKNYSDFIHHISQNFMYYFVSPKVGDMERNFMNDMKKILGNFDFEFCKKEALNGGDFEKVVQKFYSLPKNKKEKIFNLSQKYMAGNCGGFAKCFVRDNIKNKETKSFKNHMNKIFEILKSNEKLLFKIALKKFHVFAGVKINNRIEIFQAWLGKYTVQDWLSERKNIMTLNKFKKLLSELYSDPDKANEFFSVKGQKINCFINENDFSIKQFSYKFLTDEELSDLKSHAINFLNKDKTADKVIVFN